MLEVNVVWVLLLPCSVGRIERTSVNVKNERTSVNVKKIERTSVNVKKTVFSNVPP